MTELLVVETLPPEVLSWLQQRHSVAYAPELTHSPVALQDAMAVARCMWWPSSLPLDTEALYTAHDLLTMGYLGTASYSDVEAFRRAGVELVRADSASAPAEAEFLVSSLLQVMRQPPETNGLASAWVGRELSGAVVGLVGMTPGARSAARLLSAFGARVLGYDPALHASDPFWARWRIINRPLRELFEQSDAVCVLLGAASRYRGLIGHRFLPYAKPGQLLLGLSRSTIFDDVELAAALRSGRISLAWLDDLAPGAQERGKPLRDVPGLRVTPHLAGATHEARLRSAWAVAKRLDELLNSGADDDTSIDPAQTESMGDAASPLSSPDAELDLANG